MKCEVCGSNAELALDLGEHPLCDDLIKTEDDGTSKLYPIQIYYCKNCRTAHNFCQVEKQTLFPEEYHYRSRFTADVVDGMGNLLNEVNEIKDISCKKILDIGCNDGSLLDIAQKMYGCKTFGIEPTGAADEASKKGHTILKEYFAPESAETFFNQYGCPDIITFTNVFAHISNLDELLKGVKKLLGKNTILVIENHYLGGVVRKNQFDTFYHEHPRTYSLKSFTYIAQRLGLDIHQASFPSRYGGNIRIIMGNSYQKSSVEFNLDSMLNEDSVCDDLFEMQKKVNKWVHSKKEIIHKLNEVYGPLPAKAFPGRSAILFKLLGLNKDQISACYEKDESLKVGHNVPGSNIPILPESTMKDSLINDDVPIINSAWHISAEIHSYITDKLKINNQVIDLIEPSDFS